MLAAGIGRIIAARNFFVLRLPRLSTENPIFVPTAKIKIFSFFFSKEHAFFFAIQKISKPEHNHGLGVLAVGSDVPSALDPLFDSTEEDAVAIRAAFAQLGAPLVEIAELRESLEAAKSSVGSLRGEIRAGSTTKDALRQEIAEVNGKRETVE